MQLQSSDAAGGLLFAEDLLATLPSPVALALRELAPGAGESALVQLWRACEAVELCVRIGATILFAEVQAAGRMGAVLGALQSFNYRGPTLGQWKALLATLAKQPHELPLTRGLHALARAQPDPLRRGQRQPPVLASFFDGEGTLAHEPDYQRRFTSLRNRLAHGAGLSREAAEILWAHWRTRIRQFLDSMATALAGLEMLAHVEGVSYQLRGPRAALAATPPPPGLRLCVRDGEHALELWPLMLFGPPQVPQQGEDPDAEPVVQVYASLDGLSRHQQRTFYTPLGCADPHVHWCQGDPASTSRFLEIFAPLRAAERKGPADAWSSFEIELRDDAKFMMGRRRLLDRLRQAALDEEGPACLWVPGAAGSGKSTLMAKLCVRLHEAEDRLLVPYRFRAGDARCSRADFLALVATSVASRPAPPGEEPAAILAGLGDRMAEGRHVILLLDGLDEIHSVDDGFLAEVLHPLMSLPQAGAGRLKWILFGRPDIAQRLPAGVHSLFGRDGLPPMQDKDVRAMLLEQLGRSRLELLRQDEFEVRPVGSLLAQPELLAALDRGAVPEALLRLCKGEDWTQQYGVQAIATPLDGAQGRRWLIDDDDDAEMFIATLEPGGSRLEVHADFLRTTSGSGHFIAEVTRRAGGLPIYVKLVVDERRDGLEGSFDPRQLPSSLVDYYDRLLLRQGIGDVTELKTPLVCALALARDALTFEQLDQLVAASQFEESTPEERAAILGPTLDLLMPMLSERRNAQGRLGYILYHQTLREHVTASDATRRRLHADRRLGQALELAVRRAHARIARWCSLAGREGLEATGALREYVERFGIEHLLERDLLADALRLFATLKNTPEHDALQLAHQAARCAAAIDDALQAGKDVSGLPAGELCALVGHTYETGLYVGAIRVLIEHHPAAWEAELERRLAWPYDLVFRHDAGEAYGQGFLQAAGPQRAARLAQLRAFATDAQRPYHREIAGYALQAIYDDEGVIAAGEVDFDLIEAYAASASPTDRMIAGELVLGLALRGVDLRGRIASPAFWQPCWDYHARDVDDILFLQPAAAPGGQAADPACARIHRYAAELRALLRDLPWFQASEARRRLLEDEGVDDEELLEELGEAYDAGSTGLVADYVRLLMCDPRWEVIERGASLASGLVRRNFARLRLIDQLAATTPPIWRVQYGAVDAAFNIGAMDGHRKFQALLADHHANPEARVRGLCADDLLGWIRLAPPRARRALLQAPETRAALAHWLAHGSDCWELEYAYLIVRFVKEWSESDEAGYPWEQLVPAQLSVCLQGTPAFHELDHAALLGRIEAAKRAGRSSGTAPGESRRPALPA